MMLGNDWGFGWGGMWFGWLMMSSFTIAVVVLIVWLVRLSSSGSPSSKTDASVSAPPTLSAVEILQARYSRGEISKEEYLDARTTLLRT
jgi:putative membrane protein